MAVAENAGVEVDSSGQKLENGIRNSVVSADGKPCPIDHNGLNPSDDSTPKSKEETFHSDQNITNAKLSNQSSLNGPTHQTIQLQNGFNSNEGKKNGFQGERLGTEMRELVEMLSKLNPMAKEFVPPSLVRAQNSGFRGNGVGLTNSSIVQTNFGYADGHFARRRRNNDGQGKRRANKRTSIAQQDEVIRRTVYVSDIDQQVTEEQLASIFLGCGQVVDCRICGDPNSVLRFAFVEFTDEVGARAALTLSGTILGYYPVKVHPSKTAIAPINPTFLPRSENEREMCSRTIYCTNIDKKMTEADVQLFFESVCGEVQRLRLLGDFHHHTRIAFVEFTMAESAIAALSCSGAILGTLPIRVSPSKTPVRPRFPPRSNFN